MTQGALDYCLQELGKALGLRDPLALTDGVLTLCDDTGNHWILQCPDGGGLLVVYSPLLPWDQASAQDAENGLRLNSRFDILQGAWLGLHPVQNVLCLFHGIPLTVLNGPLLYTLLMNLRRVRADVVALLKQPGYGLPSKG